MTLDFITDLLPFTWREKTYNLILIIVEPLIKYILYEPITKDMTLEDLVEILYDTLIKYFTVLKHIVSDCAKIFTLMF